MNPHTMKRSIYYLVLFICFFLRLVPQNKENSSCSDWVQNCVISERVPLSGQKKFAEGLSHLAKRRAQNTLLAPSQNSSFDHLLRDRSPYNSYCNNLGFENLNLNNWLGYTYHTITDWPIPPATITNWLSGFSTTGNNAPLGGFGNLARHTVITIPPINNNPLAGNLIGYDSIAINPNTGLAEVPFLPPNSNGSVIRLGNANVGSEAERITYQLSVSPQNSQLTIRYALVLNDAHHPAGQQPFFQMLVKKQDGTTINGCGVYSVDATNAANDTSFKLSAVVSFLGDAIYYKKWTMVGLDLSTYIGQDITIEFITADCSQGGHFGYAYIDASCSSSELSVNFCQGDAHAIIVGPTGYNQYQWYGPNNMTLIPGATNDSLTLTNPTHGAIYFLKSHAANGCSTTLKALIQNTSVNIKSVSSSPTCQGGSTGSVAVTAGGSSTGYIYNWYNSSGALISNNATATGLPEGTYSVTVSSPGCGMSDTTIAVLSAPPFIILSSQEYCGTAGFIIAPPGNNYSWYDPAGNPIQNNNNDSLFVNSLSDGSAYTVVYQGNSSCHDSLSISLEQILSGNVYFNHIKNVCPGLSNGTATIHISSPYPGSFNWNVYSGNGFNLQQVTTDSSLNLTNLATGMYQVIMTDGRCYYGSQFMIDTISIPLTVTASPLLLTGCDTSKVHFNFGLGGIPSGCKSTANSGASITQHVVGTATGQNLSSTYPSAYGNWYSNEKYQILYTANELASAGISPGKLTSIAFNVISVPVLMNKSFKNYTIKIACTNVNNLGAMPIGGSLIAAPFTTVFGPKTITVAPGWNTHDFTQAYEWDGNKNIVIEICYDWMAPNSYSENAVVSTTNTPYYSFAVFNSDVVPSCTSVKANSSMQTRPLTRFGNCLSQAQANDFTYSWNPATGIFPPLYPTASNAQVFILPSSTQSYTLTTTHTMSACVKKDTFTLTVSNPFQLILPADTFLCSNHPPVPLTAITIDPQTGNTLTVAGSWSGTGITNLGSGVGTFNPQGLQAGPYSLVYTAGPCNNIKDTLKIEIKPFISAAFSSVGPFCIYGQPVALHTLTSTNGGSWTINGNAATQFNPRQLGVAFNPPHLLQHIIDPGTLCADTAKLAVSVYPQPQINFKTDHLSGCLPNFNVQFQAQVSEPNGQYIWDFGDNSLDNGYSNNPLHTYNMAGTFSVQLIYISPYGCSDTLYQQSLLTAYPAPAVDFTTEPSIITSLDPTADFINLSPNETGMNWLWDIATLDSAVSYHTEYLFPNPGQYPVTLWATNQYGCKSQVTRLINIQPDHVLYVPNAFTPDSDGLNDIFIPVGDGFLKGNDGQTSGYELNIFNRWGEKVFESHDPAIGWNGRIFNGGQPAQGGIYVYSVVYTSLMGRLYTRNGTCCLVR